MVARDKSEEWFRAFGARTTPVGIAKGSTHDIYTDTQYTRPVVGTTLKRTGYRVDRYEYITQRERKEKRIALAKKLYGMGSWR